MVTIKGGKFIFGDFYDGTNTDAIPIHTVKVESFKMGKYEVTYQQFDHFAEKTGRKLPKSKRKDRGQRAVSYITWDDALAFCQYYGFRLPTETEWEYAARSGGKNELFAGVLDKEKVYTVALTKDERVTASQPVGLRKPNGLGLYDMSGNVFEWIGDYYQFYTNPFNTHDMDKDAVRIIRGGSYYERRITARTYWRVGTLRDVTSEDIGFRCAADL